MASRSVTGVLTNLILGERTLKRKVVKHLLSSKAPGESWAVLDNDAVDVDVNLPGVHVSVQSEACICCNALAMRVALTRLLREALPTRLLLLPSSQARLPALMSMLWDQWLAPVLEMRASIAVMSAAGGDLMGPEVGETETQLQRAQIIAMDTENAGEAQVQRALSLVATSAPTARVVILQGGALDPALLQVAGSILPPRATFGTGRFNR